MFKKLIIQFWNARAQFVRYFITGFSGVFLDLGTLYLFSNKLHVRPLFSIIINQLIILVYIFCLNKYWTFKANDMTGGQIIRFIEVYIFNYTVAIGWMWLFNEHYKFDYMFVRLGNIVLATSWNFILYKFFVYKSELCTKTFFNY
jgi:dolichol-phosphate mannosyltransferase